MAEQNTGGGGAASTMAMSAYLVSRQNRALESVREQYANDKHHDFNVVKEDATARREEHRADRQHRAQMDLEKSITTLSQEVVDLERSGDKAGAIEKKNEIGQLRRTDVSEDAFDTDEVTKNFASTLDEVIEDFGTATRDEMKVSINRMASLMDSIEVSNSVEKDFLLEQYKQTQDAMQAEFNKRATIAARATEKMSELGEQYLDIQSLYAGFVDHNPIMMAMFKMGGDFLKRSRESKKAQAAAIVRDKKNQAYAEKLNAEKQLRASIERARDDEVNGQRQETLKIDRSTADKKKSQTTDPDSDFDPSSFFDSIRSDDDDDGDTTRPIIERDSDSPLGGFDFPQDEFSGTGDAELTRDQLAQIFGSTDEDGDPVIFERDDQSDYRDVVGDNSDGGDDPLTRDQLAQIFGTSEVNDTGVMERDDPEPFVIDDTDPVDVRIQEETPEQKAQEMFVRQATDEKRRNDEANQIEKTQIDNAIYTKLTDIETAILDGNRIVEKNGKALEDAGSGGGIFAALGLGKIATLFKGPILKALMLFGPAVAAIGTLLTKFGLGGLADKLTGGFDRATTRMGGEPPTRNPRPPGGNPPPRRGGSRFARMANGIKGAASRVGGMARAGGGALMAGGASLARGAGGTIARGGAMAGRAAMGLLGTSTAAVAGAGAAGYGVGTLINNHVLEDDTKEAIGDFIGPKIDSVLSFFGNEDAKRRGNALSQVDNQSGKTMGTAKPKAPMQKTAAESLGMDHYEKVPKDASVMEKQESGNNLVIQADNINSTKIINTKGMNQIEVPVQRQTQEKLQMLESKVIQLQDAKASAAQTQSMPMAPMAPTKQNVVSSQPASTPPPGARSARNDDSSIQRLTDRFVGMGMA